LRMPYARIYAYDIDPVARAQCKEMAVANDVADRILIGEAFDGDSFTQFANDETLLIMDIEGDENDLLDPAKYPALKKMDIIVEMHDSRMPNLSTLLPMRFAETHDIRVMPNVPFSFPLEKIMGPDYVPGHFDNLIATWEGRSGPTPFGIFIRKP
jgi:hypothetical protein